MHRSIHSWQQIITVREILENFAIATKCLSALQIKFETEKNYVAFWYSREVVTTVIS
jgi:hypothetical protein